MAHDFIERRWEKLMEKCAITPTGCWQWLGASRKGYGRVKWYGQETTAHRLVYVLLVGPVDSGLVVDHRCRNTLCVNPIHMDIVTGRENLWRDPPKRYRRKNRHISFTSRTINGRGRSQLLLTTESNMALRLTGGV